MSAFGRVDSELNVFLKDGDSERKVGQYLLGGPEEALTFFESKFSEFVAKVVLLEQRAASGKANSRTLMRSLSALNAELEALNAVGDFAAVRARLHAVSAGLADKVAAEDAANAEIRASLLADKEAVAAQAESIAARKNPNWKQSGAEMDALFAKWQELQRNPVKLPKNLTDPIWKRFSTARKTFEAGKRAFFNDLDQRQKKSRATRLALVASAESIDPQNPNALASYRDLLDQWKKLGRTAKQDEPLWLRLKTAGDRVFAAKKEKEAAEEEAFKGNLVVKVEILEEAEQLDISDLAAARERFRALQVKWSAAGKVPKNQVSKVADRWERVKRRFADAEAANWKRTDTAALDRSNALTNQLEVAIADLEERLKQASGKDRGEIESQLEIRRGWLAAARAAVS